VELVVAREAPHHLAFLVSAKADGARWKALAVSLEVVRGHGTLGSLFVIIGIRGLVGVGRKAIDRGPSNTTS
jgi:hypothetical protein